VSRAEATRAPVRVLQVVPDLRCGGAERVALDLALHLDRDRFEVSLLALYPATGSAFEAEARDGGVPVHHLGKRPGLDLRLQRSVRRALAELRPDVVHGHNVLLHNLLPACIAAGVPARVHTVHNLAEREIPPSMRPLHRAAFRWGGVVPVSISAHVQASVARLYAGVTSPVVPNGLDVGRFARAATGRERWRRENGVAADAMVFAHVGRFMAQKRHGDLVAAFARVAQVEPRALLLLAGEGELHETVRAQAQSLGIDGAVRFLGLRADVPELLGAADAFVLSSAWEGLPIAVLEAMAAGLPVVATAVGGVPELVRSGETGWLVPPGAPDALAEAMIAVSHDPHAAQAAGANGARLVRERHSVEGMVAGYEALYLGLVGRAAGTGRGAARRRA